MGCVRSGELVALVFRMKERSVTASGPGERYVVPEKVTTSIEGAFRPHEICRLSLGTRGEALSRRRIFLSSIDMLRTQLPENRVSQALSLRDFHLKKDDRSQHGSNKSDCSLSHEHL